MPTKVGEFPVEYISASLAGEDFPHAEKIVPVMDNMNNA
jgi:hypothetical protein